MKNWNIIMSTQLLDSKEMSMYGERDYYCNIKNDPSCNVQVRNIKLAEAKNIENLK